jgi:hypothetical protein
MEENDKKNLYIETTIPSYATSRESTKILVLTRQVVTKRFWEEERRRYNLYTSQYTIDECSGGDSDAAKRRLEFLLDIPVVFPKTDEIARLADTYFKLLSIPERAKTDCFHLATCVVTKMDYLLSWNFTHLGFDTYIKVSEYNIKNGLWNTVLITPDYLFDADNNGEK